MTEKLRIKLVNGLWYPCRTAKKGTPLPANFYECLSWTHKRNLAENRLL